MLNPSGRLTLVEALRPPPGHRLDSAMAVTFTLDLRALLAAPAAFALGEVVEGSSGDTPIELLHALRTHAARITVLSQAGEIAVPPSDRVFSFLDGQLVPVVAPRHGVVHPKIWVLRYAPASPDGNPGRLRVLVGSRNLTFDASWDTLLRLDETATGHGIELDGVAELFDDLIGRSTGEVAEHHRERVADLGTAVRAARFAAPEAVAAARVHIGGIGASPAAIPFPSTHDRALVMAPFVTDDFFSTVLTGRVDHLVSRQESLAALSEDTRAGIDAVWWFDDGGDLAAAESVAEARTPDDPGRPAGGLHAKVFIFETGNRATVFVGSANATRAAFGANVEILVELQGPVSQLGIERLLSGDGDDDGLANLIHPFTATDPPVEPPDESALDGQRRRLARIALTGHVAPADDAEGVWVTRFRSEQPLDLDPGVQMHCRPLTMPSPGLAVAGGTPLDVAFRTSLDGISALLVVELTAGDGTSTAFVWPATLSGVPDQRDRALLSALVGGGERFLRYLLAVLEGDEPGGGVAQPPGGSRSTGTPEAGASHPLPPVLERMLRAVRRDPAELRALAPLVQDLAADNALPDGFADLWDTMSTAAAAREQQS